MTTPGCLERLGVALGRSGSEAAMVELPASLNRKIGAAMHDYAMLQDRDRVLVAVSGGIDSLVAAWVLQKWRAKAPVRYDLAAVFIDNGYLERADDGLSPGERIGSLMSALDIPFFERTVKPPDPEVKNGCYVCSRNRRTRLFELAREKGFSKLAFGHHLDDLLETFFLNLFYSGNISTMVPKQELFGGRLSLIRVLAYLEKQEVVELGQLAGLEPVAGYCPMRGDTRRDRIRALLSSWYSQIPSAKRSVFAALGNVRDDYLLTPAGSGAQGNRATEIDSTTEQGEP